MSESEAADASVLAANLRSEGRGLRSKMSRKAAAGSPTPEKSSASKKKRKSRRLAGAADSEEMDESLQDTLQQNAGSLDLEPEPAIADSDIIDEDEVLADESEVFGEEVSPPQLEKEELPPLSPVELKPATKKIVLNRTSAVSVPPSAPQVPDGALTEDSPGSGGQTPKKVVRLTEISMEERLKLREVKFGATAPSDKKVARAERFGINSSGGTGITSAGTGKDLDLLKKRAERFGVTLSKDINKLEQEEKLRKRKERFGSTGEETVKKGKVSVGAGNAGQNGTVKKGSVPVTAPESGAAGDAEAKKMQRAQRFAMASK